MGSQIVAVFIEIAKSFSANLWFQALLVAGMTVLSASLIILIFLYIFKSISRRTVWELDTRLIATLRLPMWYSLILSGLLSSVSLLPVPTEIQQFSGNILWSIGITIWMFYLSKALSTVLRRLADIENKYTLIQPNTLPLFANSSIILCVLIGCYSLSRTWAIDITTWLASAGVIGIAVGFAAKDTLANLFSGMFILADAPYKIGDYIVLDNGDRGLVRHIGLRSTKIFTRDDVEVTIPNSIINNSKITNQSGGPIKRFRLRIQFSVAYGTKVEDVRRITIAIAQTDPLVLQDPAPRLRFRRFESSGIAFELLCWVKFPAQRGRATDSLNEAIYNRFIEDGIEIPNTKQDLYIKELPHRGTSKL